MDMSVKLNLSYPAARTGEQPPEKRGLDKPTTALAEVALADDSSKPMAVTDVDQVKAAVSQIESFLSSTRRNLEFTTDEESGKIVVRIIASDTGELVRQLPSEEALRIAHSLNDVNSLLFDAKA
ncbi:MULTISPECIES: flagellar protein FlaG [Pseudomonas]|uniref:Flagellar protein FlaG n=1 Tax=Pseudomonas monteilii TaxID=76759 RepID=A0A7W2LAK8_9PSED|nr:MULTISPECIES: flagellar protein FlaG [Pseudomonas]MBA6137288.1 flagellar protein FlaG [Pseudomonas monteilii]MCA4075247.1 flagellar protein FlaG [Pseudomonas kurunegalensis]MDT3745888.1 flagellar protein FlaG [Pseudomonas kurunegalensis]MVF50894.1 flagellar protein FlaG [Pseudomonas monteilii]